MNIKAVLRDILRSIPHMEKAMKTKDPIYWIRNALNTIGTKYAKQAGIASLEVGAIWIGNGMTGLCWNLPENFRKKPLTEMQKEKLRYLESILETDDTPGLYYSTDEPEPEIGRAHV